MSKIFKIVFSKIMGLMVFLILLVIINRINIDVYGYDMVVDFINFNTVLFITLSIVFMLAEVNFALTFPFNLPAPIVGSFASMFLVTFISRGFGLVDILIQKNIFSNFYPIMFLIYPLVFVAVLIGGYISIFSKLVKCKKPKKSVKKAKKKKEESWDDIGDQFKKAFSNLFRKISEEIDKK